MDHGPAALVSIMRWTLDPRVAGGRVQLTVAQLRGEALRTWVSHVIRRGVDNSLAYVFDPEFLCHAWEWVGKQGKKPSSGAHQGAARGR